MPDFLLIVMVMEYLGSDLSKKALVMHIPMFSEKYMKNRILEV